MTGFLKAATVEASQMARRRCSDQRLDVFVRAPVKSPDCVTVGLIPA